MKQIIGVLKEPSFEKRVALLPPQVKKLVQKLETQVLLEENYAVDYGIPDQAYRDEGAEFKSRENILKEAKTIISINDVFKSADEIPEGIDFIGIYNPLFFPERIEKYTAKKSRVYSLDCLPRTTLAQNMDVRSSMDSLSGYKAVLTSTEMYGNVFPMLSTAAGTLKAAQVLVLGAGVAGLQAIATAKRLGAVVNAFDVRKAAGEEVRSLGAKFIEVEGNTEAKDAGGYAVEQTKDYAAQQNELINKQLKKTDIAICTANIPGKKAPILIDENGLDGMPNGSVVIDLAAEQGGNCSLTQNKKTTTHQGTTIYGNSYLSRELPKAASTLLSSNFFNFLKFKLENGPEHDLMQTCEVTKPTKKTN